MLCWDTPSPSPSPRLATDVDSASCPRRPVRRIIVSIKVLQHLSKTLSLNRPPASFPSPPLSDSDDWWLSPHAQAYSASLPVNVLPLQTPPPGRGSLLYVQPVSTGTLGSAWTLLRNTALGPSPAGTPLGQSRISDSKL